MGNLYTQLIKRPSDQRISILYGLKIAYRTFPRDEIRIKDLKEKLKTLDFKKPIPPINLKKKYGLFAWKHN